MACERKLKSDNFFWMCGAPKMIPFSTFSIIGHRLAYGLNVPQTSPKIRLLAVIKSVLLFVIKWTIGCQNMFVSNFEEVECCNIRFTLGSHAGILTQTLCKLSKNAL